MTAPNDVWDRMIEKRPKVKMFKNKGLPLFEDLEAIYTGTVATGKYSHAANESESDNHAAGASDDDEEEEGDDDVQIVEPDEGEGEQEEEAAGAEVLGESDGEEGAAGRSRSATPRPPKKRRAAGTPASAAAAAKKATKKTTTPPGETKARAAGPPLPKKVKLSVGDQLVASVNALAAAIQSGNSEERNGRTAAIKSFNNTAIAKHANASQRLAFKGHLVQGQNYVLFNMLDFTSKDGIAEVEEYVIGVVGAIETVEVEEEEEEEE